MKLTTLVAAVAVVGASLVWPAPTNARCGAENFNPTGTSNYCVPLKGSLFDSCKSYAYMLVDRGKQITVRDFVRTCVEANGGDYWYGSR